MSFVLEHGWEGVSVRRLPGVHADIESACTIAARTANELPPASVPRRFGYKITVRDIRTGKRIKTFRPGQEPEDETDPFDDTPTSVQTELELA